ncbi:S-adenosyl-L-methionine-dependent methyltransferase [Hyaloraphidium curvatum]|nr:S-adenosyl-L-methionine-dependent methyltransferase [Hyaloraphidium curvatum]
MLRHSRILLAFLLGVCSSFFLNSLPLASESICFKGTDLPLLIVETAYKPAFYISMHHPKDDNPRASLLTTGEYYESADLRYLANTLHQYPHGAVLDVGANIGIFSLFAASQGAQRIYAFEPNPRNVAKLRQSIAANPAPIITIIEAGASNVTGVANFSAPPWNTGMGRISHELIQPNKSHLHGFTAAVKMVSIDAVVPTNTEISFLKIDVEGNELFALRSASHFIRSGKVQVIMVEITQSGGFETLGIDEMFEWMYSHGYAVAVPAGNSSLFPFVGRIQTLLELKGDIKKLGEERAKPCPC